VVRWQREIDREREARCSRGSGGERQGRAMVLTVIILLFIDIFWWLKR
jgi:hypothetical protein